MSGERSRRGGISAEELMAELEADPQYTAEQERRDTELRQKAAEWRRAEGPLIEELRDAGFEVESAWDLVNTSMPYPAALPILLRHLERPYPDRVREGIARALAVPDARFGWHVLTRLYEEEQPDTDAKDGLAVAIAAASDDEVIEDVMALARDQRHGASRVLLLVALARSRDPRARGALQELERDPDLDSEVQRILKRTK